MAAKKRTAKTVTDKPDAPPSTTAQADLDKMLAEHAEAEKYRPSEEALVLARIYDGEARTPWQLVPDDSPENDPRERVTELDLLRGRWLVTAIVEAFRVGDREMLDRLEKTKALFCGEPEENSKHRLVALVRCIEDGAREHRADPRGKDRPGDLQPVAAKLVEWLGEHVDSNFLSLDQWDLRDALETVTTHASAIEAAARLAIKVEAFGTYDDPERTSAGQLDRMKNRLKMAERRVK